MLDRIPSTGRAARRVRLVSALLAASALALGGTPGFAQDADTLVVGLEADPTCLDGRQVGFFYALNLTRQVLDSLTDQDPVTGKILPWLAESWTVNDTATEFTFTLREGVTYSDGAPVDAASVVLNFDDLLSQSYGTNFVRDLTGYEAVDERTVRFHFSVPNSQFLQATSTVQLALIAPASLAATPEQRCAGQLLGSGPYVIDSYTTQQQVTMSARPDYAWASPISANQGPAHIDKLVFQIIPEAGVRNGSLLSGSIDIDHAVQEQDEPLITGSGAQLLSAPSRGLSQALLPNEQSPIWSDTALRQAVALAVNREELSYILSTNSRIAGSVLTSATPGYSDMSGLLKTDIDEAKARLDALGWVPGPDGVRVKGGKPLELRVVLRRNPIRQAVLELLQQQFAPIGARLVIDIQDSATATESERNGNYDFVFWSASRNDVDVLRNFFDPAGLNPIRRTRDDSEFFVLLDKLRETVDDADRQEAVDRFVEIVLNEVHAIPLFESTTSIGATPDVHDLVLDAANRPLFQQVSLKR